MHAFILGVPGRYRGAALEGELAAAGLDFTVIPGPDARSWTSDDLAQEYSPRAAQIARHRQLAPAEVACALGHQAMVRALLHRGELWGLLLEDDARFTQSIDPVLECLRHLPDTPIVVQLGGHRPTSTHGPSLAGHHCRLWRQARPVFGSYAYLMNRRAALIAERTYRSRKVDSPADWPFCWATRVEFWRPEADVAQPDSDAESLIKADRRVMGSRPRRTRSVPVDATIGVLQLLGAAAVYGRFHGLPLRVLYKRDRAEGLRRFRRPSTPPAVTTTGTQS